MTPHWMKEAEWFLSVFAKHKVPTGIEFESLFIRHKFFTKTMYLVTDLVYIE